MNRARIAGLLSILALIAPQPALAQPTSAKGEVKVGIHEVDMKANTLYAIKIEGKGFQPQVQMSPGNLSSTLQDFNKPHLFQSYYMPNRNENSTIYIVPSVFNLKGKGPFEYTIDITPMSLAAKALLDVKDELTGNDAPYKAQFIDRKHHKSHDFKLEAGKTYVIDMKAPEGSRLDCYIYLLDGNGKLLRSDDDGGGFPNSRIVFEAPAGGSYQLIATGLGEALGAYTLTVRAVEKK